MPVRWKTIIRNVQSVAATEDVNRRKRLEQLAAQLGTFDDVLSREELLRLRSELRPQL